MINDDYEMIWIKTNEECSEISMYLEKKISLLKDEKIWKRWVRLGLVKKYLN